MSKILKNTTGSSINIIDTGITISASPGSYTIPSQDYLLWAASSDVITYIGSGDLVVNDGSNDLSISEGTDLIKGLFPSIINTYAKNRSGSGSLTSVDTYVSADTDGCSTVMFHVTGTWIGALALSATVDGTNWFDVFGFSETSGILLNVFTVNAAIQVSCGGYKKVRVYVGAYTSGTINIAWQASLGSNSLEVFSYNSDSLNATAKLKSAGGTTIGGINDSLKVVLTDGTDIADIIDDNGTKRLAVDSSVSVEVGQQDKTSFTEGTTTFQPIGGVKNDTLSSDVSEDNAAAARITGKRALHVNMRNNSGTEIGTESNPVSVSIHGNNIINLPENKQDSFGNNIFVEPTVIFSTHFSNSDHSDFLWNKRETTGGTVTHVASESSILLNATTSNGSKAEYQTYRSIQYIPGQALDVLITAVFSVAKTNQTQRIGLRNSNDSEGMYFQLNSNGISVVLKGALSTITVLRDDWDDPMDGTGASGINLDLDGGIGQIFGIKYQWLGYGNIEFGFQFGLNFIVCHTIHNINTLTQPYSKTPSFQGFAEISNSGTVSSSSSLRLGCFSMRAFGDALYGSHITSCSNKTTLISVGGGAFVPIIAVRLDPSLKNNEAILEKVNIFSSSSTDIFFELVFNASITGGSWVNASEGLQQNTTITSYSGGVTFYSDYFDKKGIGNLADILSFARLGRFIDETSNTILVIAKSTGGNASVGASLIIREVH